eukprot:scaffold8165_cov116-Isochrysis_galbana.AAC.1
MDAREWVSVTWLTPSRANADAPFDPFRVIVDDSGFDGRDAFGPGFLVAACRAGASVKGRDGRFVEDWPVESDVVRTAEKCGRPAWLDPRLMPRGVREAPARPAMAMANGGSVPDVFAAGA